MCMQKEYTTLRRAVVQLPSLLLPLPTLLPPPPLPPSIPMMGKRKSKKRL